MTDITIRKDDFVHLSRIAVAGKSSDASLFLRRLARRYQHEVPELAADLTALLRSVPALTGGAMLRDVASAHVPVDADSRLRLLRVDESPGPSFDPVWEPAVAHRLNQFILERQSQQALANAGLVAARSAVFAGPPGVGKTLAARWIAGRLQLPLLTLDLSAVMSSFLGRTGNNLRYVMDYAKSVRCVLFLDEIDAVAKRRDDPHEMGELKRLVSSLLQEVDDWPASGILLAATNHPALLDPAAWRRFDAQISFPLPSGDLLRRSIKQFTHDESLPAALITALSVVLDGRSFSDIERDILTARRAAVLGSVPLESTLRDLLLRLVGDVPPDRRREIATQLLAADFPIRQISDLTTLSRDTIKKLVPIDTPMRRGRPPKNKRTL